MRDVGRTRKDKRLIDVQISHTEDLGQVAIDIISSDGSALSAQDIIDCVSEALLLKYDNYDLESPPEEYDS